MMIMPRPVVREASEHRRHCLPDGHKQKLRRRKKSCFPAEVSMDSAERDRRKFRVVSRLYN